MLKEIEGYRRTSVKTRSQEKLKEKIEQFKAQGEETKVIEVGGYSIIYVKLAKKL